jgi:hypothetical protein
MWFKAIVLLRLPIGVICMLGYAIGLSQYGELGTPILSGALMLTPFVLLSVVSIQLVRHRKGALRFTPWLLGVESLGAVFLVVGGAIAAGRVVDPLAEFAVMCVVLALWTAPNALAFYKARGLFAEPAKEEPGH